MKTKNTDKNSKKKTAAEPQEQGRTHERPGLDDASSASYAIDAERLEHGIEALNQALGDALNFFLREKEASKREAVAFLPIETKLEALSWAVWLDAPEVQVKLVGEVTLATFAIQDCVRFRQAFALAQRAVPPELLLSHAKSMLFAAERMVTGMHRDFPEFKKPTSRSIAPPDTSPSTVPNWDRRARERAGRAASGLRPELPATAPTVEPPNLEQASSAQADTCGQIGGNL